MSAYPGDPGTAGDPDVSRVLYALRDLHVRTHATAIRVLDAVDGAGLRSAQITAVLTSFPAPQPPPAEPVPQRERWRSYHIPGAT